jgi:hypothetical protein
VSIFKRRRSAPDHELTPDARALVEHLRRFFPGRVVDIEAPPQRRVYSRVPTYHLIVVRPAEPGDGWLYVTSGCWAATQREGHGIEFIVWGTEDRAEHRWAQMMTAWYHSGPPTDRLGLGHTLPIGEPWLPGSRCDHLLVSLPYPWGPDLEICDWPGGHIQLLWLLPITRAERDFKAEHGLEALESKLEDAAIIPTDPHRPSVV